jgi:hypothetical protein
MPTITAELPTTFAPTLNRFIRLHHSVVRRGSHPLQAPRRTRSDVLQLLAGADSGRFHHVPKRRKVH